MHVLVRQGQRSTENERSLSSTRTPRAARFATLVSLGMINLGTRLNFQVDITPWHSSMHNMGFGFNRSVWHNIMEIQEQFCAYDDYNWDYSLLHLSQNRKNQEKFKVIMSKGPRVFHIGEW